MTEEASGATSARLTAVPPNDPMARGAGADDVMRGISIMAQRAGDLLAVVDGSGRVIETSASSYDLLGWSAREMTDMSMLGLVHPDDQEPLKGYRESVQAGTAHGSIELRLRTKGGAWRWFQGTALLLTVPGTPQDDLRVIVVLRSIDELVRETHFAEREAARLRALLDSALDPWLLMCPLRDRRGRIVDFVVEDTNEAAATYLRWPRERLLGTRIVREFPALVSHGLIDAYADAVDRGMPVVLHDLVYPHEVFGETRRYELRAQAAGGSLLLTWRDTTAGTDDDGQGAAGAPPSSLAAWAGDAAVLVVDDVVEWASPGARDMGLVKGSAFTAGMTGVVSRKCSRDVHACAATMHHGHGYAGRWSRDGEAALAVRARPAPDGGGGAMVTMIAEDWTPAAGTAAGRGPGHGDARE